MYNFMQCLSIEFHFFRNRNGNNFCLKDPSVFRGNFESLKFQLYHPDRKDCVEILEFSYYGLKCARSQSLSALRLKTVPCD